MKNGKSRERATLVLCFFLYGIGLVAQTVSPKYHYLDEFPYADNSLTGLNGPARVISSEGRSGLNMTSIHSVLELKAHTMKEKQGTVSMWIMPLEDLCSYDEKPGMKTNNPNYYTHSFLSDNPNVQDYAGSSFKLAWTPRWHPSLVVQFGKGIFYEEAFDLPHKAIISISHLPFHARKWYQLTLTWDYEHDKYTLYFNGILIGKEDQFKRDRLYRDSINSSLYVGIPSLVFSDIKFYDKTLSEKEVYGSFRSENKSFDKALESDLLYTYKGEKRKTFNWAPDKSWTEKFALSLTKKTDMDSLYIQGNPIRTSITDSGLLVETINKELTGALLDSQVYVWSNKPFEGDIYIEYDFKVLRPGGLSLLMIHASGMNREDFMADYPLRTSGRMTTVYGENVRNYHWEYYREMADMTNHVENSAMMKNPYLFPLSFGSLNKPVEKDKWHKLQFCQIGNKLVGAINGIIMVEYVDDGFINNGPVYDFGRIAIRCMLNSKLLFRNLKVYTKEKFKTEEVINGKSREELIFQSGFEENCQVVSNKDISSKLTPGFETDKIVGIDQSLPAKNDWDKDMNKNPDCGEFLLEYTGGNETQRYARIIQEPGNPGNRVLHFWLNDSWLASENQVKARVQANIYGIRNPYKEFYQSVRVFLHEDFNALKKYPHKINWLTISEFWNNEWWVKDEKYGFRIGIGIGKPTAEESELNFLLNAENAGQKEVWRGNNTEFKVPIGKWFTMEYYFKEGNEETGRFYLAVTPDGESKQVVFDIHNFTHNTFDPSPNGLSGYNPMKLYTSKEVVAFMKEQGKTLQVYWDDLRLWKNKRP